jgi:two-component system LytT family response regulator
MTKRCVQCLIVDDERLARRHLARLLAPHADFHIAGEAVNAIEAMERIADLKPDVAFLDIEMPGLNAFDMLAQISEPPLVIFTTAYDEYAIQAFDANAIDYVLKPIQPSRLAQALEKVREKIQNARPGRSLSLQRGLSSLRRGPPAKIAARRGRRIILLAPREILFISIEDGLVFAHTHQERFVLDRTIGDMEVLLTGAPFFRVSRSAIVNLNHARELIPGSSGTSTMKLVNGLEIGVSRDRARTLRALL